MDIAQYNLIHSAILSRLTSRLSPALTYHGVHHTEDVLAQVIQIAAREKITDEQDLLVLKTSALYHDSGFLLAYKGHEEESCKIATADLLPMGIAKKELDIIHHLIMATRVPQQPFSKLEEIICDADLDYLGRDDFFPVAETLFEEWKQYGIVKNEQEWNTIQLKFMEAHHYFTPSSQQLRNAKKMEHLDIIRKKVASYA